MYSGDVSNFTRILKILKTFEILVKFCKTGHIPTIHREKIDEKWSKDFETGEKQFFYVKSIQKAFRKPSNSIPKNLKASNTHSKQAFKNVQQMQKAFRNHSQK